MILLALIFCEISVFGDLPLARQVEPEYMDSPVPREGKAELTHRILLKWTCSDTIRGKAYALVGYRLLDDIRFKQSRQRLVWTPEAGIPTGLPTGSHAVSCCRAISGSLTCLANAAESIANGS